MKNTIVSKFGGSETSTPEGVKRAIEIVKSNPARRYVVASAPAQTSKSPGITDLLFMCHSSFHSGDNYVEMLGKISNVYESIIDGLNVNFDLDAEILEVKKALITGADVNQIASRGEYIMGKILASVLGWDFVDASEIIFFNSDGTLDEEKTFTTAGSRLKNLAHAVIPGFYGKTPDGKIKTFQRGDGDSSGAIVARAVGADLLEKWSETTKIFGADPAVIPYAELIPAITYSEAIELNYIGINIISDNVIFMMRDADIPIRVASIYSDKNTMITSRKAEDNLNDVAVCVAGRRNFSLLHIEKYGLNKQYGFGERLFGLLAKYHIACEHCLSGIYKMSLALKSPLFDLRRKEIFSEINKIIDPDSLSIEKNLSLIAVIGQGMGTTKGIFEKVFAALAKADIKVRMIDQGSDDLNIMIGVRDSDYENAVRALYANMIAHVGA
ncbi:MAG: aspartate kinase [Synergistaceae bacterium]|nr:aspartate kinase [Synergistaceae bacterium]